MKRLILLFLLLFSISSYSEEVDKRKGLVDKNEQMDDSNPSKSFALKTLKVQEMILITSKVFTPPANHKFIEFDKHWMGAKTHVDVDGEVANDPSGLPVTRLKDSSSEVQVMKAIALTNSAAFPLQMEGNMVPVGGSGGGTPPELHWAKKVENCKIDLRIDSENDNDIDDEDEEIEECYPGKAILVNDADTDGDLFKDYADGFNFQFGDKSIENEAAQVSRKFIEMTLDTEGLEVEEGKIIFNYKSSDPNSIQKVSDDSNLWGFRQEPAAGNWRIWIVNGDAARRPDSILKPVEPGHFIPSGEEIPLEKLQSLMSEGNKLYLECVRKTPENESSSHKIEVVYKGKNDVTCQDEITVSGVTVEVPLTEVLSLDWADVEPIKISGLMFGPVMDDKCKTEEEWWREQYEGSEVKFSKKMEPAAYIVKPELNGEKHERLDSKSGSGDSVIYKLSNESNTQGKIRIIGGLLSNKMKRSDRDSKNIDKEFDLYTRKSFTVHYGVWMPICKSIFQHEPKLNHLLGRVTVKQQKIDFKLHSALSRQSRVLFPNHSDSVQGVWSTFKFQEGKLDTSNVNVQLAQVGNFKSIKFRNSVNPDGTLAGNFSIGKNNSNTYIGVEPGVALVELYLKIKNEEDTSNILFLLPLRVNPLTFKESNIAHIHHYNDQDEAPLPGSSDFGVFENPYYKRLLTLAPKSAISMLAVSDKSWLLFEQMAINFPSLGVNWHDHLNMNMSNVLDTEMTVPVVQAIMGDNKLNLGVGDKLQALQRMFNANIASEYQKNLEFNYLRHIARSSVEHAALHRLKFHFSLEDGPESIQNTPWFDFTHISAKQLNQNIFWGDNLTSLLGSHFGRIKWSLQNPYTEEIVNHMISERGQLVNAVLNKISTYNFRSPKNNVYFLRDNALLDKVLGRLDSKLEITQVEETYLIDSVQHKKNRIIGQIPQNVRRRIEREVRRIFPNRTVKILNDGKAYIDIEAFHTGNGRSNKFDDDPDFEFNFYIQVDNEIARFGKVVYNNAFETIQNRNNKWSEQLEDLTDEIDYLYGLVNDINKENILQYFKEEVSWVTYHSYLIGDFVLPAESLHNVIFQSNMVTGEPIGIAENAIAIGDVFLSFVPGGRVVKGGKYLLKSPKVLRGALNDTIAAANKSNSILTDLSNWGSRVYKESKNSAKTALKQDLVQTGQDAKRLIAMGPNTIKSVYKFSKKFPSSAKGFFNKSFIKNNPRLLLHNILGFGMLGGDSIVRKSHAFTGMPMDQIVRNGDNAVWALENPQHALEVLHSYVTKTPTNSDVFSAKYLENLGASLIDNVDEISPALKNTLSDSESELLLALLKESNVPLKKATSIVDKLRITLCFKKGTKVLMADGSFKNIENIRVGDIVLSRDENYPNSEAVASKVNSISVNMSSSYRKVSFKRKIPSSDDDYDLYTTSFHPFWSLTENKWIPSFQLRNRDNVRGLNENLEVTHNSLNHSECFVYNLSVEGTHSYFVLAENAKGFKPVWVHNDTCVGDEVVDRLRKKGIDVDKATDRKYIQTIIQIEKNAERNGLKFNVGKTPEVRSSTKSREILRENLTADATDATVTGYQAHHIYQYKEATTEGTSLYNLINGFDLGNGRKFPGLGLDVDDASNGIFLRGHDDAEHFIADKVNVKYSDEVTHAGGHAKYNEAWVDVLNDLTLDLKKMAKSDASDSEILKFAAEQMNLYRSNTIKALEEKGTELVLHMSRGNGPYGTDELKDIWYDTIIGD